MTISDLCIIIDLFHLVQFCEVRIISIFDGIDNTAVEKILSLAEETAFEKNENIYKSRYIGYLISGSAKVIRTGSGGNSITVRNINRGDIFGSASIFGNWNNDFSKIISQSECRVKYFSEDVFLSVLKNYPQFSINYISFLTDRIRFLNRRLDTFSAGSTQNKLYEFLLSHADNNNEVNLNISLSELAKRLGIGRTSLYRDITSLEDTGFIIRKGKKFIIK